MSGQWQGSDRVSSLPSCWSSLRAFVLDRDDHRCRIRNECCIGHATEVDHIDGQGDDPSNLRAACSPCHAKRSSAQGNAVWARARAAGRLPREPHPGLR